MKYDMQFAHTLRAGFPAPSQGYYKRIDETIALLQSRDEALTCAKSKHTAPEGRHSTTNETEAENPFASTAVNMCFPVPGVNDIL